MNLKIVEYKKNLQSDNNIREFISDILFNEFDQNKTYERPDLDDLGCYVDKKNKLWLLISENCAVIGTIAILSQDEYTAKIKRFYIHKNYRNRGWGERLFNKALFFCKRQKVKKIILNNDSLKMKQAYSFYIKHGFKEIFKREDGYVTMELKLK